MSCKPVPEHSPLNECGQQNVKVRKVKVFSSSPRNTLFYIATQLLSSALRSTQYLALKAVSPTKSMPRDVTLSSAPILSSWFLIQYPLGNNAAPECIDCLYADESWLTLALHYYQESSWWKMATILWCWWCIVLENVFALHMYGMNSIKSFVSTQIK